MVHRITMSEIYRLHRKRMVHGVRSSMKMLCRVRIAEMNQITLNDMQSSQDDTNYIIHRVVRSNTIIPIT